jgi:elongation factor 1-alpha
MSEGKAHLSIVICGHVDAGKSTTTGRLIFELGGISEREVEKLKAEADKLGKGSFAFAFYMDRQKEERERGVTISCTTKEFFTTSYHYTVIDAPGHRDFIKNMITGASQADVALLMVPSDGNFTTSIAKGNPKAGEVQGQTRQHSVLINLLGVKQLLVGVNKMDCDVAGYKEERYVEIRDEMMHMLKKVGWKKPFVDLQMPVLPISGWMGDNLIAKSTNMAWWKGMDISPVAEVLKGKDPKPDAALSVHVDTLLDCLEKLVPAPTRDSSGNMRVPLSGVYKIKGVGDVLTGRVEMGKVSPGDETLFIPTHSPALACVGKVFTVEMHHKNVDMAAQGDNVGMNVKGLPKDNMPRVGDVMIKSSDKTLERTKMFKCQVQVLNHPGELKVGYCPIAFVRTGRSAVKLSKLNWKVGKTTGNAKVADPPMIKAGEMGLVQFEPSQPFVVEAFKSCAGLGRVAIMEGNSVVMLGKASATEPWVY